jgi:hypothetical protein
VALTLGGVSLLLPASGISPVVMDFSFTLDALPARVFA